MPEVPKDIQHLLDFMDETCGCNYSDAKFYCDCVASVANKGDTCKNCKNHSHKLKKK